MSTVKSQSVDLTNSCSNSTKDEHKVYWIKCSDGGIVSMGGERLEFILNLMPTLRYLLLGHPSMKAKGLLFSSDGIPILKIPSELKITKFSFGLLVNVVLEAAPIPPRNNNYGTNLDLLTMLEVTLVTLGGCAILEERLNGHHSHPSVPEEDINNEYEWQILRQSKHVGGIDLRDTEKLIKAGYSYTGYVQEDGDMRIFVYRKKKIPCKNKVW